MNATGAQATRSVRRRPQPCATSSPSPSLGEATGDQSIWAGSSSGQPSKARGECASSRSVCLQPYGKLGSMWRWVLVVLFVLGCAPQAQGPREPTLEELETRTREQAAREQAERDQADRARAKEAAQPETKFMDRGVPSEASQPSGNESGPVPDPVVETTKRDPSTMTLDYSPPTASGCSRGCRCGDTCIACSDTCRRDAPAYSPPSSSGPQCKKGCPCGNACISCSKRCRK